MLVAKMIPDPIKENQLENRRVVMTATPMSLEERAQIFGDARYGLVQETMSKQEIVIF